MINMVNKVYEKLNFDPYDNNLWSNHQDIKFKKKQRIMKLHVDTKKYKVMFEE